MYRPAWYIRSRGDVSTKFAKFALLAAPRSGAKPTLVVQLEKQEGRGKHWSADVTRRHVLVIGGSGRLGTFIVREFGDCDVVAPTRSELDLTDADVVDRAVAATAPALIVNCAAFNDVDGAEERPIDALAANAFAVRSLARAAERCGALLVHYSTDFVFDGTAREPYGEDAKPSPRSTYGASKLLGEWFALDAPHALVLRVESLFGSEPGWTGRQGTLDTIVDGLARGGEVRAFTDRVVSPSYMADVAAATRFLVDTHAQSGVYHCVNTGQATWYQVAEEAARLLGVVPRLTPVTMDEVTLKAERPRYCALATGKIAAAGFEMPSWRDALRRWLAPDSVTARRHR
jgi:dTDP-4-dehydrorhamnose reductase